MTLQRRTVQSPKKGHSPTYLPLREEHFEVSTFMYVDLALLHFISLCFHNKDLITNFLGLIHYAHEKYICTGEKSSNEEYISDSY